MCRVAKKFQSPLCNSSSPHLPTIIFLLSIFQTHSHFLFPRLFMFLCLESTQLLIIQGVSISKFRVELKENVCLVPCQFSLLLLYLFPAATFEFCETSEDTSGLTEIREKWGIFCSFCFCAQHAWE